MKNKLFILFFMLNCSLMQYSFAYAPIQTTYSGGTNMSTSVIIENGVINVLDYGAIPDDANDDTAAIKSAISAAISNGNKTKVFLPTGKYVISSTSGMRNTFNYTDVNGVVIEGDNAVFELTDNYSGFFKFDKSMNIDISGITFDYVHPPWTQGEVTAIDVQNGSFTFETPDVNQNIFDDVRFGGNAWLQTGGVSTPGFGMVRDKNDPTLLKPDPNFFVLLRGVQKIAPGKYELYLHQSHFGMVGVGSDKIEVGDKYVHSNRGVNGEVFDMRGSGNISISNCTIYASPGCTLIGANALGYIKMDNVHTKIKPNSGRFVSSNADGIHIQSSRYPVEITNCTFEGLADDGMNLYQRTMQVTKVIANNNIEISGVDATGGMPMVGDIIDIINAPTGAMRGTAKVVGVTQINSVMWNVVLETPIENIQVGENRLVGDTVYNRNVQFPNSIIRNNTFKNIRGRGTLLRVIDTIVENNKYINLSGSGIVIRNFPDEYEGASGRNITIKGNEFTNIAFNRNDYGNEYSAAIQIVGITTSHGYTKDTIHENITIESNTFESYGRNAIYAGAVDGLTIKNNTFVSKATDRVFDANMCVININNVINGIIKGNSITEPREAIQAEIKFN